MQTRVVVLVRRGPDSGPDGGPAVDAGLVLHPLDDLAALPSVLGTDVPAVLLAEATHTARLGRAAGLVAAADGQVASRALPHGPLAIRLLGDLIAHLDLPAAHTVASLDGLALGTWSGAWLPSVARLASPSPSMGQHVRSLLPGGDGFLVEHHPRPRVRPVDRKSSPAGTTGTRPVLAVAGDAPAMALDHAQLLASARARVAVPSSTQVQARYGTSAAVELAALPAAVPELPPDGPPCGSCGLDVPGDTCPFCHRVTTPLAVAVPS